MALVKTVGPIEYPETDGQPMGETDLHRDWMVRILDILRHRYRDQQIYLASDLLIYYEEGEPSRFIVPDVFVVKDTDPGRRRIYKVWEEGKVPDVVFEVTSLSSRRRDESWKPQVYAEMGVQEYFIYDPTEDYLTPPLQGYRLVAKKYDLIAPDEVGRLLCEQLHITLRLDSGELVFEDAATGIVLQTAEEAADSRAEAADSRAEAADSRAEAADSRAEAAERRAAELEAEVRRLREQLKRKP